MATKNNLSIIFLIALLLMQSCKNKQQEPVEPNDFTNVENEINTDPNNSDESFDYKQMKEIRKLKEEIEKKLMWNYHHFMSDLKELFPTFGKYYFVIHRMQPNYAEIKCRKHNTTLYEAKRDSLYKVYITETPSAHKDPCFVKRQ
jgi:hypothetical protein